MEPGHGIRERDGLKRSVSGSDPVLRRRRSSGTSPGKGDHGRVTCVGHGGTNDPVDETGEADPAARVEYIISDRLFEGLPAEEQKLWHSHAYEVKTGLWVNPRVPEMIQKTELENLARTYGKFWCTWQVDRGDRLPLGAPALMMSPQGVNAGAVRPDMVKARDDKYGISSEEIGKSRVEIGEPEWINPQADYWKQHGKGFAVDVVRTEMKTRTPFP
ncbi:hypothetical protein QJS10_CPB20g01730 [Acorus calamus]|uniref:Uncharacterized protein n=1 Tax=Acorus calamus TaxID=4465 RepID=A0AAV9CAL1_ACOCL|nr:hypothetical protein QJS10_CPB20g01730 [Acorus calamus]